MCERLKVGQFGKNGIALSGVSSQYQDTEVASISNGND